MMGTLVSVVIPTYNRASLVSLAVESVLAQTVLEIEVLVIDDQSTDDTETVLRRFGDKIVYKRVAHSGLPAVSRNVGIRAATGDFIAFLDDDDRWLPDKLEKQLRAMASANSSACSTNAWRAREGEADQHFFLRPVPARLTFRDLLATNWIICSSAIVRRSVFGVTGPFPEARDLKALEDYALWIRVATQTDWTYLSEPLAVYTDLPSHSIRREAISVFEQRRRVFKDVRDWAGAAGVPKSFRRELRRARLWNAASEARHRVHRLFAGQGA